MSHSSSPNGTDKVFATVVHGPMRENPYRLHVGPILGHYGQHIKVIWSSVHKLLVNRLLKPAQEKVWLSELTVPQ